MGICWGIADASSKYGQTKETWLHRWSPVAMLEWCPRFSILFDDRVLTLTTQNGALDVAERVDPELFAELRLLDFRDLLYDEAELLAGGCDLFLPGSFRERRLAVPGFEPNTLASSIGRLLWNRGYEPAALALRTAARFAQHYELVITISY